MPKNIYTPYTYLIGWSHLNKFYYGVRYAKQSKCLYESGCHPDDFFVTYFTSSNKVSQYINKYGDPDIIEIRKTFNNAESAKLHEFKVIKRMKMVNSNIWLNEANGGTWSTEHINEEFRKKLSNSLLGKQKSEKHKENISNGRTGIKFSDDHIQNIRNAIIGTKQSKSTRKKRSKTMSKLKWWNNGLINIRAEVQPDDTFVPGRIKGFKWKKRDH